MVQTAQQHTGVSSMNVLYGETSDLLEPEEIDTLLFTAIIRITVPEFAQILLRRDPSQPTTIRVQRPLQGGSLGLHIITREPDTYIGQSQLLKLELYSRYNQRRQRTHFFGKLLDTDAAAPSHTLVVHERVSSYELPPTQTRFIVPRPLVGEVVFIPIVPPRPVEHRSALLRMDDLRPDIRDTGVRKLRQKKPKDTEAYLKKLLLEGWRLESRSGRDCVLSRNGKTIDYRIPKN